MRFTKYVESCQAWENLSSLLLRGFAASSLGLAWGSLGLTSARQHGTSLSFLHQSEFHHDLPQKV
jgi:hypothetical protein